MTLRADMAYASNGLVQSRSSAMTSTKAVLLVGFSIVFVLVGLSALVFYGAYERSEARTLALEKLQEDEIARLDVKAANDEHQIKCSQAWDEYKLASQDLDPSVSFVHPANGRFLRDCTAEDIQSFVQL
jgi:hypothetical protein